MLFNLVWSLEICTVPAALQYRQETARYCLSDSARNFDRDQVFIAMDDKRRDVELAQVGIRSYSGNREAYISEPGDWATA